MTFGLSGAALAGVAAGGATLVSGYMGAKASRAASATQAASAQQGIDEQRRQFDAIQKLLQPYVKAGTGALSQQQALLGLTGEKAQEQAISQVEQSPQMQAMLQQGEEALLQNASATGGLRGGNIQGALAQFRPQLLSDLIQQRFSNLGNLTTLGQNAAAGVGTAGQNTAGAVSKLLETQGAAVAGGQLAGGFGSNLANAVGAGFGIYKGLGGKF